MCCSVFDKTNITILFLNGEIYHLKYKPICICCMSEFGMFSGFYGSHILPKYMLQHHLSCTDDMRIYHYYQHFYVKSMLLFFFCPTESYYLLSSINSKKAVVVHSCVQSIYKSAISLTRKHETKDNAMQAVTN